jgi:hypothetical protein
MRRQYLLAALALISLLAAAPSWNDTTCDRTTPSPAGWADVPTTGGDIPLRAGVSYGARGIPGPGIIGIP